MTIQNVYSCAKDKSVFENVYTHKGRWKCLFVVCVKEAGHYDLSPEHTVQLFFFSLWLSAFLFLN